MTPAAQLGNFPVRKLGAPDTWEAFVELFRGGQKPLPQAWSDLFGPLRSGLVDYRSLPSADLQAQVVHRGGRAETFRQPVGVDRGSAHGSSVRNRPSR